MNKQTQNKENNVNNTQKEVVDSNSAPHYDREIVPAEVAARQEREGDKFMEAPKNEDEAQVDTDATRRGFTVDNEGLVNNFAIEPEMYINEPGDLREKEQQLKKERADEYVEAHENDEQGRLTMDKDNRTKGPGVI